MDTQNLQEMTGMSGHDYHSQFKEDVNWRDERLAKITRVRMLSDAGMSWWDVTYCHGILKDGTLVNVTLPFYQLNRKNINAQIIKYAKEDGVFAKGLGIFDALAMFS